MGRIYEVHIHQIGLRAQLVECETKVPSFPLRVPLRHNNVDLRARNKSDTEYSQQFAEIDWGIGMHDSDILKCFLM